MSRTHLIKQPNRDQCHSFARSPAFLAIALIACLVSTEGVNAAIDCDNDRESTVFHMVITLDVKNLPPRLEYPGAETAEATQIILQWPSAQFPERAYMNEVFTIDLDTETVSLIDGIDGRAQAENPDIRDLAEDAIGLAKTGLLDSNFGLGLISVEGCMHPDRNAGLVFVLYGHDSQDVGFQVAPFTVREDEAGRIAIIAPNEGTTDQVGLEFNTAGADIIMAIMEEASGTDTYDMARVNAENIYQETIPFIFNAENERNAKFGDPEYAIIHSNQVVILGEYALVRVAEGVRVFRKGEERHLFASRAVSGLRGYLDFYGKATLELEVAGYHDRRLINLLEGDTSLETEAGDCGATVRITSSFEQPSSLKGRISLYDDGELLKWVEDDLDKVVDCDGSEFTVVGERVLSGVDIPATEHLGYVFIDPDRELRIIGLDTNGDGKADRLDKDQDGLLDGEPIVIGCDDTNPRKDYIVMDPPLDERTYTFTANNAPNGWEIIEPNLVQYNADCQDANTTVAPEVRAFDGTAEKGLTIQYSVTD